MGIMVRRLLCLDLITAALVIGYLEVFGGIWEIIEILLNIVYFEDYYDANNNEEASDQEFKSIHHAILLFMFVVSLLDLLSSILLIQGTYKKSHRMLLPWIIMKGIALVILIPVNTLIVLITLVLIFTGYGSIFLVNSILLMTLVGLYSYIYMVIYSLYCFIRDDSKNPPAQIDSEAQHYLNISQCSKN